MGSLGAATGNGPDNSSEIDRITGGGAPIVGDFSFVGELSAGDAFVCTAELVSPSVIITAKHCDERISTTTVRLGMEMDGSGGVVFPLKGAPITIDGTDLALRRLEFPAPYQPVQLTEATPRDGTAVTVIGWRRPALRQLDVIVQSHTSQCDRVRSGFFPKIICTQPDAAGESVSPGDSGGPVLVRVEDGSWRLAGVISGYVGAENYHADVAAHRELLTRLTAAMADETCTAASGVSRVEDLSCAHGVPVAPSTLQLKVIQQGWYEAWVVVYNQANEVVCSQEHLRLGVEVEMTCPIGEGPFVISGGARLGGYKTWPYEAREPRLCARFDGPFFNADFKPIKC